MKKVNLVGRAFGRVTSSQKVIDKLIGSGFEKVSEHGKSTVLLKRVQVEICQKCGHKGRASICSEPFCKWNMNETQII